MSDSKPGSLAFERRRQIAYWRLLEASFAAPDEQQRRFEEPAHGVVTELGLPELILDPVVGVDTLLQRFPDLGPDFEALLPATETDVDSEDAPAQGIDSGPVDEKQSLRRAFVLSKLLLNVFGPNTSQSVVSAQQYSQWTRDVDQLARALGLDPGQLRGQRGGGATGATGPGASGPNSHDEQELRGTVGRLESDLIRRMALREVLADDKLAAKLTPSIALVEELLRDKANLSGVALKNAKDLIRRYIDELAEVLLMEVERTSVGKIDYSVPPKRVFRNLDFKRTLWKNLVHWNTDEERLYVNQLYFKHTARQRPPGRLIIVVDQSGSMVDAMVNCTILASIFAGLPNVDAHLVAYDTRALDMTPWVDDPFEVLLRTELGGGTAGMVAMEHVHAKIEEPRNSLVVWISDFYDFEDEVLFRAFKALKESEVRILPVGSVSSSGYHSVNPWFKQRFKELECPIVSGSVQTLIREIKEFIA